MNARLSLPWIKDIESPAERSWEEFYRNRWQHDKVVRSTHGVNCTGGCSWNIHVKDGIVTWEMQALDYPSLANGIPPYEPRGCQRGISYSWYLYSPLRVKYPYIRGALMDLWKQARAEHADPVDAWASLVNNPEARSRWQKARGKGGLRRTDWDTVTELISASLIHTIKTYGPDRIAGFSPIPAMSMVSYASGARMLQLMGGVSLSFYDWYCDLPSASPETWGEQTDVAESADWYNAKLLAVMGSNLNMTRTPDCHFAAEARHNGTKMWVFSPDFNQVAKYADEWAAINAGQDGAWWMAVNHVLLKEFHHERPVAHFLDYARRFTDAPLLVELTERDGHYEAGQLLRANRLQAYADVENGDWKFLMWDEAHNAPKMPMGSVGFRWGSEKGKWNLLLRDGLDGKDIHPTLTFLEKHDSVVSVRFDDFSEARDLLREVPVRFVGTADGRHVAVATVYDLLMAQYGVSRGLKGDYPANYDDENAPYTPAWSERYTGLGRDVLIKFAREWGRTAELTGGKCTIIIGAGINHWYHANLMYRAGIHALMFCGCVGVNGGGLAHYVGQEKLAPGESWSAVALAKDWFPATRLQNAPSWHYVHTDQWRYEKSFTDYHTLPAHQPAGSLAEGHTIDIQARAVRSGWLPFYPQFNRNPIDVVADAEAAGARDESEIIRHVVEQLRERKLGFAVEDPDAPENWPRVWFIWRGNALMASAKGHEYFLKHYLGTHHNEIAEEIAADSVRDVKWREPAPQGKMDLVVDLNFRMDTSALYSDIVLPAATWYEKDDLNSTDMHSFIHPLSAAVPPCWEAKSDWGIFRTIARKFSELAARHLPEPVREIVATPLAHDSAAEIAQPTMADWRKGEVEPIPGKTMPALKIVTRDYKNLYNQYISFGPLARDKGLGAHGTHYEIADVYDGMLQTHPTVRWGGRVYPSLDQDRHVCDLILHLATVTNGELAYRSYKNMEEKVGLPLARLAEKSRSVRVDFATLQTRPQRFINSPMWSGLIAEGRPYSPFTYNVECLVPWRTLTGRQHFYLDHPGYIQYGEHLPTYKPKPSPVQYADLKFTQRSNDGRAAGRTLMLNYLTPHGKWHIHSTYGDNQRMTTLSRGVEPLWINDRDAAELGIVDNDWVEVHNDNGVVVTRAAVSARLPRGICIQYHSPERTYSVPKSPLRGYRRAGGHNSLTRVRLKPNLMVGGYGQFTFHFNYWGPIGCNRDTHILVRKLPELVW
ncbi:MAG TPA: nitrate reductase subunit alpha [Phycisphaerae bacterium]|nr:nitrate reductase subunit alpha [Phycisphaerae bacterium]HON66851.1 nitrate reductase subunit alpha [Phycisphaerae bacterium]HPP27503.1 nitrate reductase subunit alpha [Phycisphaerae bacterium]HPU26085.1 nitrate reductase subunit alpha [Phycisphaerae bacterium]